MSNPRETLKKPISILTDEEVYNEIIYVIETIMPNPKLARSQINWYTVRVSGLLIALNEGPVKDRLLEKLRAKKRFTPYYNDSGIIDLTGYVEHLF